MFANWCPCNNASLRNLKIWLSNGVSLDCMLVGGEAQISELFQQSHFHMRLSVVMMLNNSVCHHSSAFSANSGFQFILKLSIIPCTTDHFSTILVVLKDGPIEVQNSVNITLPAEGTVLNFLVLGDDVFPLHASTSACKFILVHSCFITYDNPLQKSLFFMIQLQKWNVHFHV